VSTPGQSVDDIALNAARIAVKEFANSDAMRDAMSTAIQSALEKAGMNISTPEAREKLRRDMEGLRTWTEFWDFVRKKGVGTTINWLITGALAALASGIWLAFHK
jgi:hypothetical protein